MAFSNTESFEMNYHYKLGTCCKKTQEHHSNNAAFEHIFIHISNKYQFFSTQDSLHVAFQSLLPHNSMSVLPVELSRIF